MNTSSSEFTDSSIVKLFHKNTLICDFEISTQRFRSATVVDYMQQICFIIGFVVCTRFPTIALKGYGKSLDLCMEHCPLELIKMCSRVCIYIYLRSIKTLDQMVRRKIRSAICTKLDRLRCASLSIVHG